MAIVSLPACFALLAAALALADTSVTITASASLAASTSSPSTPQTHTIAVGRGGNQFSPDQINADVGDVVEFQFYPANHSVARAEYKIPCMPYEYSGKDQVGFFSGFKPMTDVNENKAWSVTINDTEPVFFYCSAVGSCLNYSMVGVINPNDTQTLDVQKAFVANATTMLSPGEPIPGEASSSVSLPSSTSASTPSATSSASIQHSHHLSGGAIAGIVVGALAVLLLSVALFFYIGRTKSLKDILERKRADVPGELDAQSCQRPQSMQQQNVSSWLEQQLPPYRMGSPQPEYSYSAYRPMTPQPGHVAELMSGSESRAKTEHPLVAQYAPAELEAQAPQSSQERNDDKV